MRGRFGKKHHFFGKHHTKEARSKISKARLGKTTSDKQKRVVSEKWTGTGNPNYKPINNALLTSMILKGKSLREMGDYFGISAPGMQYKIRKLLNITSYNDIKLMVKNNTLKDYIKSLNIKLKE